MIAVGTPSHQLPEASSAGDVANETARISQPTSVGATSGVGMRNR